MNADLFIDIANKYVGVTENPVGSNRGPLIDRWNTNVNAPLGSFWCASFVSAVAMEWEAQSGNSWPLCFSADCDVWLASAKKHKCLQTTGRPGDLVLLVANNDAYHIGIVTGYSDTGTLVSVEGNSNNDGSRNGYMVAKRSNVFANRSKSNVMFIRPWQLLVEEDVNTDWNIHFGKTNMLGVVINNKVYVPVRKFVEMIKGSSTGLVWNDGPELNGVPLGIQCVVRDNVSYASVRELAPKLKLEIYGIDNKDIYLQTKVS